MNSHTIKKPNGGVTMRRVMDQPDPNENLFERVLSRDNVQKAWKRVNANKGVPGIDHMSIEDFPEFARAQWDAIRESLMAGTYQPFLVKRVGIPKPTGGKRPLGIPTVLDRLIQMETCPYTGNPDRYDQSMAQGTRFSICQRTMSEHSLSGSGSIYSVNRLVRTRILGGMGRGVKISPLPDCFPAPPIPVESSYGPTRADNTTSNHRRLQPTSILASPFDRPPACLSTRPSPCTT